MPESNPSASLFDRIGGRSRLTSLVRQFYADVRQHREIGPIFNAQIQNWPEHLEKIGDILQRGWICGAAIVTFTFRRSKPAK